MVNEQAAPVPDDAPAGYPADPDAQLAWMITELIQERAAKIDKGNIDELVDLANWVSRAMSGSGFGPLEFAPMQREGASTTACLTCTQCKTNRTKCTSGYTICKQQYDACVACPCIPP